MLQTLDQHWREHLASLDHLRQGIHLRGYAQKNPKQEYKREAFELFSDMLDRIKQDVVEDRADRAGAHAGGRAGGRAEPRRSRNVQYQHADYEQALAATTATAAIPRSRRRAAVRARRAEGRAQRSVPVRHRARNTSSATAGSADVKLLRGSLLRCVARSRSLYFACTISRLAHSAANTGLLATLSAQPTCVIRALTP